MADIRSLGEASLGVWSRDQAVQAIGRNRVDQHVKERVWQSPLPGVYADAGHTLSAEQWGFVAVLASDGADQPKPFGPIDEDGKQQRRMRAVVCGRSAARIWKLPLIDDNDPATGGTERYVQDVHVWRRMRKLTAPAETFDERGYELRRHQLTLRKGDLVQHESGLWLTSELRTAVQCVALLGHEAGVCVLDNGLHRGLFTREDLEAAAAVRTGHPGVEALHQAIAVADERSESPNETLARLLLTPVLPNLVPQVEQRDRFGKVVARFDLGDKEVLLAVDMDGKAGHAGEVMVAKDRRRDRSTAKYGWWTERGTWYEVRRQQRSFVQRVVERHTILSQRAS